ncbi:MAG TPA: DUF2235 domain-containing protein [Pseudonocardiaceae bacterium]|nr:DUF2235 domain-containing protein [Pseudonocardiaceae bacterium]
MKRLVLCCDGTWNTADQPAPTNVEKIAKEVTPVGPDGVTQTVYYHDGVGTKPRERFWGGVFGVGLSAIVRDTYRAVITNFAPGDELFFLGFSRGAYTARSTVGLIRNCGILRPEHANKLDDAYTLYRRRDPASTPDAPEAVAFRADYSYESQIRFVGVWDTVGALGIPLSGIPLVTLLNRPWQFHDTQLSSTVDAACQALAIDEHRRPFQPAVWTPPTDGQVPRHQTWFAGVHSDVGGGYPDHGLSDITLRWMAAHAHDAGLAFYNDSPLPPAATTTTSPRIGPVTPGALAPAHNTLNLAYQLLGPITRQLGQTDPTTEAAATSATGRLAAPTAHYQPTNLTTYLQQPNPHLEPVEFGQGQGAAVE